ncbi:hypothetical protein L6452_05759 [Arctium lappa]|uniref:Uncharacterized protein n=1 Tax=Arctium lappa TaxID=4217 RepID=A0ACB9EHH9_ARCLA|nr:hypothetical protein L6452_05759 [Arctium lappa]
MHDRKAKRLGDGTLSKESTTSCVLYNSFELHTEEDDLGTMYLDNVQDMATMNSFTRDTALRPNLPEEKKWNIGI